VKGWAVLLDFDGTMTTHDVSDALLARFGGLTLKEILASYGTEVSVAAWMRRKFLRVRRPAGELERYALRTVRPRAGLAAFLRACRARRVPVEVVSGGLDLYLDPLLARWGFAGLPRWRATTRRTSRGLVVRYPFLRGCGIEEFKRRRVLAHRRRGRRVLFVGDGTGDLRAARAADAVFARAHLLRHCRRAGVPARPLRGFDAVRRYLEIPCSPR
jgi:HAD superfamily phosphoserine phosphatase-like hydrolase